MKEQRELCSYLTIFVLAAVAFQSHGVLAKSDTGGTLYDTRGKEFLYKSIRLPKDVKPYHYQLYVHPNLTTLDFKGKVEILIKCFKDTDKIIFHSKKLKLSDIKLLHNAGGAEINIQDTAMRRKGSLVMLKLDEQLTQSETYLLSMNYHGKLSNSMKGFYTSQYTTKSGEKRVLAVTQFEPVSAREAFPCFDEPEFKATFEIKILRSKNHRSISNMDINTATRTKHGHFIDQFHRSVKMSTYLVAYVVSDYEYREATTKNGIKVRVWAKEDAIESTKFAIDCAQHVITYFENYFKIKYPLPKMDLIALPDFEFGAMENWGLLTFREVLLLYNEKSGSAADRQMVGIVVAHEIAHQWFGNLVTMKWWNDLWLNEGFANYAEYLGVDNYKKEWRVLEQFASDTFQSALNADSIINTHPISEDVSNPSEINELFDSITYDKGSSVIRMLRNFLGHETYRKGLQYYLKKYAYGNAEADDLWHALSKVSGSFDVKSVMDSWIKQEGYPVVTIKTTSKISRSAISDEMLVSQQRFLIDSALHKSTRKNVLKTSELWHIPLTYITEKSDKEQMLWVNHTGTVFSIKKSGWLKANIDQMGFYRVNYDEENWHLLTDQLLKSHNAFSPVDRGGLLDDAFALASAGYVKMTIPLKLTQYLYKEREYFPWSAALSSLTHIGNMISYTEAYELHQKYLVKKLKPLELFLKWEDKGPVLDRYLRNIVLRSLCKNGEQGCIDICQDLFTKFVNKDREVSISPHLRSVVYSTVVENGGAEEWKFLWSKYQKEHDATHKMKIMAGLTSSRKPWLLSRFMQYALDGYKIRKQDMVSAIVHVSKNLVGRPLAWEFYKENFGKIVKRLGKETSEVGTLLENLTKYFNTDVQLHEVKDFIHSQNSTLGMKRASKKAVENIITNINWMELHYATVHNWLKQADNE